MPISRKKPGKVQQGAHATAGNGSTTLDSEMVARLAHSYWEARGCQGGSPDEDWLRAEQELSGRMVKAAAN